MADAKKPAGGPPAAEDASSVNFELSEAQLDQVTGGLGNFAGAVRPTLVVSPKSLIDDDDPRLP